MTKVIFRKHKKGGEVIAFFPTITVNYGNIMSYSHIGQHSEAAYLFYLHDTVKAKSAEYKTLLNELENIAGYNDLRVMQRVNHKDVVGSWV